MKRMIFLVLFLTACATTPEAQLFIACRSVVDTAYTLEPFKPRMSVSQRQVVGRAIKTTKPLCTGSPGDIGGALDIVRAQLREMVRVQNEVN